MIYVVSGLCEEAEALTQTPLRHEENMQTTQLVDLNLGHFCCDLTVLSTAAPCRQATMQGSNSYVICFNTPFLAQSR